MHSPKKREHRINTIHHSKCDYILEFFNGGQDPDVKVQQVNMQETYYYDTLEELKMDYKVAKACHRTFCSEWCKIGGVSNFG